MAIISVAGAAGAGHLGMQDVILDRIAFGGVKGTRLNVAFFQLPHSRLFPGGTRLFIKGTSGLERLVLETGKQVTLELAGLASPSAKPTVGQVPLMEISVNLPLLGALNLPPIPSVSSGPSVVSVSALTGTGTKRTFTVKAVRPGLAALMADGASPLTVAVGSFLNHTGFDKDLVAAVFRAADPSKMHVLTRTLFNNSDNLFNESSDFNTTRFKSDLPCGSVSKAGGSDVFSPVDYDYQPYSKSIPGMGTAAARAGLKREDVKYDPARLKRGCQAIQKRLEKGLPSVVGLVYNPSLAVRASGGFNETGDGGHSVPIVGCTVDAKNFLYIDVFPGGSKLKYLGGHAGRDLFPDECTFLGVFEWTDDAVRGCPVLRARPETAGPSGIFSGDQYLEVVSGPIA